MLDYSARPTFDDRDQEIKDARVALWNDRAGPRVGDFVEMLDGSLRRFTHDWGDEIQTTSGFQPEDASFYFGRAGYCSFSGSLDPSIPKARLVETERSKDGRVWFFHHDQAGASRGVHTTIPCRVYRQIAAN